MGGGGREGGPHRDGCDRDDGPQRDGASRDGGPQLARFDWSGQSGFVFSTNCFLDKIV